MFSWLGPLFTFYIQTVTSPIGIIKQSQHIYTLNIEYNTIDFIFWSPEVLVRRDVFIVVSGVPSKFHLFWALFSILTALSLFFVFFRLQEDFTFIFCDFSMFLDNEFCCSCRTYHSFLVTLLDVTLLVQSGSLLHNCFDNFFVDTKI